MLSTENDSPCPQLKNASDDDRPFLPEVDLPLPYPAVVSDARFSKFSIRDYVFTSRSKDIKTNWPFSQKSLRICLHHGVKELLPPFQSRDTLRNPAVEACANESITSKEESTNNTNAEPSTSKNHSELDPPINTGPIGQQAKGCSTETLSSWSEGEKEFPSTATSVSQSEIESVQINKPSYLPLEADTSLGVEAEGSAPVGKSENTARPLNKKCKLMVKFGANVEKHSVEDIASNYTSISEMMASKVCPVCKTFTSSSNTTLNAHIDQCLTMEPTPNWTTQAKLTRHKIKPRKNKLMTDIYATAKLCTLDELDKRNGRNCSTVPKLPTENDNRSVISGTRKMQMASPPKPEDKGDVGAVYVDASGTKVRILSKSTDVPSVPKVVKEASPKNPVIGIQSQKGISKKKRRHHLLKHHKYLHLTTQRKVSSQKFISSQICNVDQQLIGKSLDKIENEMQNQVRPSYAGVLQPWVCSKRTVAAKKVNGKVHGQHFRVNHLPSQEIVVNDTRSVGRNQPPDIAASVKNLVPCNDQSEEGKGNIICATKESIIFKQTLQQKSFNCPAIRSRINENLERSIPQMKEKVNLLSKYDHVDYLPSNIGLSDTSSADKFTVADVSSVDDSYRGSSSTTQLSDSSGEVTVNATSLKRKILSFGSRSTKTAYKANVTWKSLTLRNLHEHASLELDEELAKHSEIVQPCTKSTMNIDEVESRRKRLFRIGTVLETKQTSGATSFPKRRKGMFPPQDRLNDAGGNGDACFELSDSQEKSGGSDSGKETINTEEDIDVQRSSKGSLRCSARTSTESIDPEFHMFGDKNINRPPFKNDLPFFKVEGFSSPAYSRFINKHERPCTIEVDDEMVRESNCMIDELGSELGEDNTSNVDPIPIPGPPGSFLPSPGGTNLEEFQGNSLTTTDLLSSADQHDLNEGDSSESLLSATITKSISTASVSDKCSEPFSLGLHTVEDVTRTDASGASFETSGGNKAAVLQTSATMERIKLDETLNRSDFFVQNGPLVFEREDSRPCHCHRKERLGHVVSYNFQESQLLKLPIMDSSTMPMMERQMDLDRTRKSRVFDRLPDEFSRTSCASIGSIIVSDPRTNSPERPLSKSPDAGPTTGCANSDSVSPSSNPTLRLMGMNLMVVNKDEDSSVPLGLNTPNPLVRYSIPQISTFTASLPHCTQNHSGSSYRMSPQNAVNVIQNPEESTKQFYSMKLAKSTNIQSGVKAPQTLPMVTTGFLNQSKDVCFKSPTESYEHMGHYHINTRPNQLKNSPVGRVQTVLECQKGTVISASTSTKEIIFIDDIPQNAIEMSSDAAHHHGEPRQRHIFSHGILNSAARSLDPKHLHSLPGALSMVHEANINATPSMQVDGLSVRWSCIPEGIPGLNQNPSIAGSSSSDHSRSVPRTQSPSPHNQFCCASYRSVTAKPPGFTCRRPC